MTVRSNKVRKPAKIKSNLNRVRLLSAADSLIKDQAIQFAVFDGQSSKTSSATSWICEELIKAASQKLWNESRHRPVVRIKATLESWKMFTKWLHDRDSSLSAQYSESRVRYQLGEYLDVAKLASEWEIRELEDIVTSRILDMFTNETTRNNLDYRDAIEEFMVLLEYCEHGTFWADDSIAKPPSRRVRARIYDFINKRWEADKINLRLQHVEGYRQCLELLAKHACRGKAGLGEAEADPKV